MVSLIKLNMNDSLKIAHIIIEYKQILPFDMISKTLEKHV